MMSVLKKMLFSLVAITSIISIESSPLKGITYVYDHDGTTCADMTNLNAHWYYNWTPNKHCNNVPFIPMIWSQANIKDIPALKNANYEGLLGFNEPDNCNGIVYICIYNRMHFTIPIEIINKIQDKHV